VALDLVGWLKQQAAFYQIPEHFVFAPDPWTGDAATRLRLLGSLYWKDLELTAEFETLGLVQSPRESTGGGAASGGLFDTSSVMRPRLWDVDDRQSDGLTWRNNIDRLFVKIPVGPVDITVGRQAVSWGSAWFWKVTDRFSPFAPTDFDPDTKRGVDGLRAEIHLGDMTVLDLVATGERGPDRWNAGARFRTTLLGYDWAVSAARLGDDWMAGAEVAGQIGKVGVRGEAAWTWNVAREQWDLQAVAGADGALPWKMKVAGEVFYNGYGVADSEEYVDFLLDAVSPEPGRSHRLLRGETFHIGRYYLGLLVSQELHPLVQLVVSGISNVTDPSGMVMASLQWSIQQNVRLSAGGMVSLGQRPAANEITVPSEFGLYPGVGYMVLNIGF
jgi:hypothetical protein